MHVNVGKHSTAIPKQCQGVVPASINDIPSLVKELTCKGAGDQALEYTYEVKVVSRTQDKKGEIKDESTTYEVYVPTLKDGMTAKGILLATDHNGVPVSDKDLEKARLHAGQELEKADDKIARESPPQPKSESAPATGMTPLGSYGRMNTNRGAFGFKRGGAALGVDTILKSCDLKFIRNARNDGREMHVFGFTPRTGVQLDVNEKYVEQLTGEIWVDAADRIVTRVIGWPATIKTAGNAGPESSQVNKAPAVDIQMMRLADGVWLPHIKRINGLDYPALFDHISSDTSITYGQYKRFVTDANVTK